MVAAVLTKVRGILQLVTDESLTLLIDPLEIEVLIPEHTRRQVQSKMGEPVTLHTILYIEGGDGEPAPAAARGVHCRPSTASSSRSFARSTAWAPARPCGPWFGPCANCAVDSGPGREASCHISRALARRPPSGSWPSCGAKSASSP